MSEKYYILGFKTSFVEFIPDTWCLEGGAREELINPSEIITFKRDRKQKLVPVISPRLMDTMGDLITFSSF